MPSGIAQVLASQSRLQALRAQREFFRSLVSDAANVGG
jgi:hypothetical protein